MPRWLGFAGPWGLPPDGPAWGAVAAALIALLFACAPSSTSKWLGVRLSSRVFVALGAFVAAGLSLGYVAFYLRGAPRIVDATTYFLQGRALSEGHFAWSIPHPTASFRGRFLLEHDDPHRGATVAGIFPPGYPLLLSLGFAVGAPMVVGPLLAAAIVVATFALARQLARDAGLDPRSSDAAGRLAAMLSIVCAALRYHTADTMAHGACALAFACALTAALRAEDEAGVELAPWMFLLSGGALGFLVATRFASALALGAVLAWLAFRCRARKRALAACALGMLPGIALLLLAQTAATGSPFGSTQRAYYAASDGPPGCFRYGFGAGIGCLFEHGDFVRARLAGGYGALAALGTTARRLGHHFADVANFGPLALVALGSVVRPPFRTRGVRAAWLTIGALVLGYAPFYFDGDYPGAGARFYADALPVEHALLALGAFRLSSLAGASFRRVAAAIVAVASLGFAVHMAFAHDSLRARDGGHPMFDPEVLARAHVPLTHDGTRARALLFVETDHGFDLAHDPAAFDPASADAAPLRVVRARGDDHDRLVYERLGRPSSWIYRFHRPPGNPGDVAEAEATSFVEAWLPPPAERGVETWRFEAEEEWPPLAQTGDAWAEPEWSSAPCVSPRGASRVLSIHAAGARATDGAVTLALPVPRAGRWRVTPRFVTPEPTGDAADAPSPSGTLDVVAPNGEVVIRWHLGADPAGPPGTCVELPSRVLDAHDARDLALVTHLVTPGTARLDRVTLATEPR